MWRLLYIYFYQKWEPEDPHHKRSVGVGRMSSIILLKKGYYKLKN